MTQTLPPTPPLPRRRYAHLLILAAVLLLAAVVRFSGLGDRDYSHDELWSLTGVMGRTGEQQTLPRDTILTDPPRLTRLSNAKPVTAIWNAQTRDIHPPLYSILERLWVEAFGETQSARRSLPALAGVLNCALLYAAASLTTTRPAALFAAAVMAFAAPQIELAQTCRSYTFLLTLVLASIYVLLDIERRGPTRLRLLALVLLSLAMLLTHYLGGVVGLALAAYALVRLRSRTRIVTLSAMAAGFLLFLATWGPNLLAQRALSVQLTYYWYQEPPGGHTLLVLQRLARLPIQLLQPLLPRSAALALPAAVLYVLPLVALRKRPQLLIWYLLMLAVLGLMTGIDIARSTSYLTWVQYPFLAAPAVFVLLCAALADHPRPLLRHLLPACALFASIVGLPQAWQRHNPPLRQVVSYLDRHSAPTEPVAFAAGTFGPFFTGFLYLATSHYTSTFPRHVLLLDAPASPATLAALRAAPAVWLFRWSPIPPAEELIPGFRVVDIQYYPEVGYLTKLIPADPTPADSTR